MQLKSIFKPAFKQAKHSSGFSLIELGLALAIIALIAGGVIKGRDMLANARLQNIATQLGQIELAISSFESRYGALPGDMLTASTAFPGASGVPNDGNGNGNDRIDTAAEAARAFQELGLAQLINGQFDGITPTGSVCPSSTCPSTATGGRLQFIVGSTPTGTGNFRALLAPTGQLDVRQLAELDRKLDDGKPGTGRFQLVSGGSQNCISAGDWNVGNTADTCTGAVLVQ